MTPHLSIIRAMPSVREIDAWWAAHDADAPARHAGLVADVADYLCSDHFPHPGENLAALRRRLRAERDLCRAYAGRRASLSDIEAAGGPREKNG